MNIIENKYGLSAFSGLVSVILILIFVVFLSNCSLVDPRFDIYYDNFIKDMTDYNDNGKNIDFIDKNPYDIPIFTGITFGENTVATCWTIFNFNFIIFDKKYFETFNDLDRKWIIYHELGHCLLNYDHIDDIVESIPLSIMNSYSAGFGELLFEKNKELYFRALMENRPLTELEYFQIHNVLLEFFR